jgi:uncharacterized protein HemY
VAVAVAVARAVARAAQNGYVSIEYQEYTYLPIYYFV